jgi:hypothetical protein
LSAAVKGRARLKHSVKTTHRVLRDNMRMRSPQ